MIDVTVRPDGGDEYTVTVTSRDIAAWEKVTKGMTFAKFQEDMSVTHLYHMTWRASTRTDKFEGTLGEFVESCDLAFEEIEDNAPDPTRRGASTAP